MASNPTPTPTKQAAPAPIAKVFPDEINFKSACDIVGVQPNYFRKLLREGKLDDPKVVQKNVQGSSWPTTARRRKPQLKPPPRHRPNKHLTQLGWGKPPNGILAPSQGSWSRRGRSVHQHGSMILEGYAV
jgi:hypothetical protein